MSRSVKKSILSDPVLIIEVHVFFVVSSRPYITVKTTGQSVFSSELTNFYEMQVA